MHERSMTRITSPYRSTSRTTIRKAMTAIKASLVTKNSPLKMMMKMTQNHLQLKCPPKSLEKIQTNKLKTIIVDHTIRT